MFYELHVLNIFWLMYTLKIYLLHTHTQLTIFSQFFEGYIHFLYDFLYIQNIHSIYIIYINELHQKSYIDQYPIYLTRLLKSYPE